MKVGNVRRSQLVTTYGVGSLVAVDDNSYMIAGLDYWVVPNSPDLQEERLARRLRVSGFMWPPADEEGKDVPVVRFPEWHSCASCNLLQMPLSFMDDRRCVECEERLVPSRFVACCKLGHIDDFPFFSWVHRGSRHTGGNPRMTLEPRGSSASLKSIVIACSCGASRTMEGAFARNAIGRCTGRRPWLGGDKENCLEQARTLQRGASNVWFSDVQSSLSIPPWSDALFRVLDPHWSVLRAIPDRATMRTVLTALPQVLASGFPIDEIVEVALERKSGDQADSLTDLKNEEYSALTKGYPARPGNEFSCEPAPGMTGLVKEYVDRVMVVSRLREVRALRSFTRLVPYAPGAEREQTAALARVPPDWLPGIEVKGEGLFFELSADKLGRWEAREHVMRRAHNLQENYETVLKQLDTSSNLQITPRLLLIHTFAHVLINQWALECGYPAASLRERLYVSQDMAGVLIYTATGDSAGSLGGIVGLAAPAKLDTAVQEALARAEWCSSDPLCIETEAQGVNALNLAACHACTLLPEVSCELNNVLLDRGMLVGWPEAPSAGFFPKM